MAVLAAVAPIAIAAIGTFMSYRANKQAGEAAAEDKRVSAESYAAGKEFEAKQLDDRANSEIAASQRTAQEEQRRSRILASRATAVAGASGAGVSDPTVVNIVADLIGEGTYRSSVAMYEGEDRARTARMGAQASRFEGSEALRTGYLSAANSRAAGNTAAIGSIFSGAGQIASMYGKYGLPSTTPPQQVEIY